MNPEELLKGHAVRKAKYLRPIVGRSTNDPKCDSDPVLVYVDVYDVINAYGVDNEPLAHLIKKALCCGHRGHKDRITDLMDILASAIEAIRIEESRQILARHDELLEAMKHGE